MRLEEPKQWQWKLIKEGGYLAMPWPIAKELMSQKDMGKAEHKCAELIIAKTVGHTNADGSRKLKAHIALSVFEEWTGLQARHVKKALGRLVQAELFIQEDSSDRSKSKWVFGLNFDWLAKRVATQQAQRKAKDASAQEADVTGVKRDSLEGSKGTPKRGRKGHHKKESLKKEAARKKRRKRRPPDANLKHWAWKLWGETYPRKRPPSDRVVRQRFVDGAEEVGKECMEQVFQDWVEHNWDPWGFGKMIDRARRAASGKRKRPTKPWRAKVPDEVRRQYFADRE